MAPTLQKLLLLGKVIFFEISINLKNISLLAEGEKETSLPKEIF